MSDDHDALRAKLSWAGPANDQGRFLSVFMDQNNKCNLRCQMCGFSDPRTEAIGRYDMPCFEAFLPGVDCLHCTIRKEPSDVNDDFFYRKVAKPYEA
jgi:hypothetical protein